MNIYHLRLGIPKPALEWLRRWIVQFCDPIWLVSGFRELPRFLANLNAYSRLPGTEKIRLGDLYPQLHDRTAAHELDTHYFYGNGWAMRRIVRNKPAHHVDIGSQVIFANLLGSVLPVTLVEYRVLHVNLDGLECIQGDILDLPYSDGSVESLSCLHVAEHIGLGRYGDPLNPDGTRKAARELSRVLAPGANLFFVLPVGRPRVCYNAHRIHSAETIRRYFADLELMEFSGIHDDGRFVQYVELAEFDNSTYACGMFWFRRPA